ncbi:MAG: preprotein translocase subunit SecY, partial [Oscillospiraceae bacterium]|nr:preprotein translocase subunit SecY [Oscillospiraceae bacterium]
MLETFRNAWKITDLRKKILYTIFIILIFRLGSRVTVPFVDYEILKKAVDENKDSIMDYLSIISGGGFTNASIFALGIQPYINSSIIIQLLTVAIPALERMQKEGESGRKKIAQITRFVTVGLGLMLGIAYQFLLRGYNGENTLIPEAQSGGWSWFAGITIVLCFTAGSALMMWLGEQINERGIGNGISMLLFAGIVSRLPSGAIFLWNLFYTSGLKPLIDGSSAIPTEQAILYMVLPFIILILFGAMIAFIVHITNAERRIPVQYAKRVVGRKMYGGQNTFIPIKVNMSGVMPIILASSIIQLPNIIKRLFGMDPENTSWFFNLFASRNWFYVFAYFFMIIGFAFFYVTIQYNPMEMANNLRKNSGAIPGYRPGKPTTDYIKRVLNKVTLIGALFLGLIALAPSLLGMVDPILGGMSIGGTSIMIVVGVALETTQQIESQMTMRHYKGF